MCEFAYQIIILILLNFLSHYLMSAFKEVCLNKYRRITHILMDVLELDTLHLFKKKKSTLKYLLRRSSLQLRNYLFFT